MDISFSRSDDGPSQNSELPLQILLIWGKLLLPLPFVEKWCVLGKFKLWKAGVWRIDVEVEGVDKNSDI